MFLQRLVDLVVSGEWLMRSSKPWMARTLASIPFLYSMFSVSLNFASNNQLNEDDENVFNVFLFLFYLWSFCV